MTCTAQPGHKRKANGKGYVRKTGGTVGPVRYAAYLAGQYLGVRDTRAEAERLIEEALGLVEVE